jgi:hypothetical protein
VAFDKVEPPPLLFHTKISAAALVELASTLPNDKDEIIDEVESVNVITGAGIVLASL